LGEQRMAQTSANWQITLGAAVLSQRIDLMEEKRLLEDELALLKILAAQQDERAEQLKQEAAQQAERAEQLKREAAQQALSAEQLTRTKIFIALLGLIVAIPLIFGWIPSFFLGPSNNPVAVGIAYALSDVAEVILLEPLPPFWRRIHITQQETWANLKQWGIDLHDPFKADIERIKEECFELDLRMTDAELKYAGAIQGAHVDACAVQKKLETLKEPLSTGDVAKVISVLFQILDPIKANLLTLRKAQDSVNAASKKAASVLRDLALLKTPALSPEGEPLSARLTPDNAQLLKDLSIVNQEIVSYLAALEKVDRIHERLEQVKLKMPDHNLTKVDTHHMVNALQDTLKILNKKTSVIRGIAMEVPFDE